MYYHMEEHKKRGDLKDLTATPPYRPDAKDHWQRTPQEIQEYIAQLLTQKVDANPVRDGAPRTLNAKESGKETNKWYTALRQQGAALAEDGIVRTTAISEETQAQVLSYNLSQVEKGKF